MSVVSEGTLNRLARALTSREAANEIKLALDLTFTPGNVYFVDSGGAGASDSNSGVDPANALSTLDGGINKCTHDNGDVVIIMPGHAETYSTTGTKATFDIRGVTVIGLGNGVNRPTFTYGHTGATWSISAGGVTLQNMLWVSSVDSVVTAVTVSGADCTLLDIESRDTTDIEFITDVTTTATAERLVVKRFYKNGYTGGNANVRVFHLVGVDRAIFEDCRFVTKVTTAVIGFVTTACTAVDINRCLFLVDSTTDFSKNVVDTVTGSTWALRNSFDLGAGVTIGGGSGAAVGQVDVSTITAALYGANGITSFPASAAPANGVSIAEVLGWINDAVQGSAGVVTFPSAAAPANGVSLAEVIRAIYDRQVGNASTCGVNTRLGTRVDRSTADVITGSNVPVFTITGQVLLTAIWGKVTTVIGAGASNAKFQYNPGTGTTIDMCADLDIDADEAGTLYSITGTPGDAMLRGESGAVRTLATPIVLDAGAIEFLGGTDRTGSISFQAWYIPLSDGATLVAA